MGIQLDVVNKLDVVNRQPRDICPTVVASSNYYSYSALTSHPPGGVAMSCAGCAMHKGPRLSEGPLAASSLFF